MSTVNPVGVFPDVTVEMSLLLDPEGADRVWQDFSSYFSGFDPQRGRPDERSLVDAGTALVRLKNETRIFDPTWGLPAGMNLIENDSFETNLDNYLDPPDFDLTRRVYPADATPLPHEGAAHVRATWDGGTGDARLTQHNPVVYPASGRYLFSAFVYVPAAGTYDGGAVRLEITGATGSTFVARQDADLAKRDQWQRVWEIRDIAADLSGVPVISVLSFPTLAGAWVGLDYLEVAELLPDATTISTGPLYPNLGPGKPIRVRAGWANAIANPSFETDTTGWSASGSTLTRVTTSQRFGDASLEVDTNGSASGEGAALATGSCPAAAAGDVWSAGAWVKGAGTVRVQVRALDASNAVLATYESASLTLDATYKRLGVTSSALPASTAKVQLRIVTPTTQNVVFYVDGATLAEKPYVVPFLESAGGIADQFEGRIEDVSQSWEEGGLKPIAVVSAADEIATYSAKPLPSTNPPFESHLELLISDKPYAVFGMDDPVTGTRLAAEEGQDGQYRNDPPREQPPLIVGDALGFSVQFFEDSSPTKWAFAAVDLTTFQDGNRASCEGLFRMHVLQAGDSETICAGPMNTGSSVAIFRLYVDDDGGTPNVKATVELVGSSRTAIGATTLVADRVYHAAMSWDGTTVRVYLDGVEDGVSSSAAGTMLTPTGGQPLQIARSTNVSPLDPNMYLDAIAFYEHALAPSRILAHAESGLLRGFGSFDEHHTSQERVEAVLDLLGGLTPAAKRHFVDADDLVAHRRQNGQNAIDELRAAEQAENGLLFVDRSGRTVLLGDSYRTVGEKSVQRFSLSNEPEDWLTYPYADVGVAPFGKGETFNVARANAPGGETQEAAHESCRRRHGERLLDLGEIPVVGDVRALEIVTDKVERLAEPGLRMDEVKLRGGFDEDGEIWRAMLERDLEDLGLVEKVDPDPTLGAITQRVRVKAIQASVRRTEWATTWTLAPARR